MTIPPIPLSTPEIDLFPKKAPFLVFWRYFSPWWYICKIYILCTSSHFLLLLQLKQASLLFNKFHLPTSFKADCYTNILCYGLLMHNFWNTIALFKTGCMPLIFLYEFFVFLRKVGKSVCLQVMHCKFKIWCE